MKLTKEEIEQAKKQLRKLDDKMRKIRPQNEIWGNTKQNQSDDENKKPKDFALRKYIPNMKKRQVSGFDHPHFLNDFCR